MRRRLAAALLLAGCDRPAPEPPVAGGAALEQVARRRGLVVADGRMSPVGVYRNGSDQVCVVPDGADYRLGASVDYGEGQRCVLRARAVGRDRLTVDGGDGCRFEARIAADRIGFPPILPAACDAVCVGHASLSALGAGRLSDTVPEASRVRAADGKLLCAD